MKLAKEWNSSSPENISKGCEPQAAVYMVGGAECEVQEVKLSVSNTDVQNRVLGLYNRPEEPGKERDFMRLAKAWNGTDCPQEVREPRLLNSDVYYIERYATVEVHKELTGEGDLEMEKNPRESESGGEEQGCEVPVSTRVFTIRPSTLP